MRRRRGRRGFSLLEVMVAVGILGLALTIILSAQGGLSASNRATANLGNATTLARCKMTETEEKLLKNGYPEVDQNDTEVSCCEDADRDGFKCDLKVEKVELPNPPSSSLGDGGALLGAPADSTSPLGQLASGGGAGLNLDGGVSGLGGVASQIGQQFGGAGAAGLLSMVMGIVYPSIKPFYEMSIRKVTVTVRWKEGPNKKDLALVQYVTNPQRAGFASGMLDDGGAGAPAPAGSAGSSGSTGGSSGASPRLPGTGVTR
ncbi:MAG: type II secretion system protein [Myxococcales bacterium]|jgi:general secretion pathway protein I|nr:type II secretion system protein [Myxococcales bacterium]